MQGTTNSKYYIKPYEIVSWSSGTDAQIVNMINAHYNGLIDLHDYWSVGDTRTIILSAMEATGVGESHASQAITMVLMDSTCTGFTLTNENTTPAFIVGMKDSLNETGYIHSSTITGGWSGCNRRTWCNSIFKEAFSSTIRSAFKQFTWQQGAANGESSGLLTTQDYFALPPEKAILGNISYSQTDEGTLYSQWTYYQTSSNRIKNVNGSAYQWFEGSPYSGSTGMFCNITSSGTASYASPTLELGLSPFGCI